MCKRTILKLVLNLSVLLVTLFICSVSQAKIIYVDDSALGANNGSSWTDAYVYLQDALANAISGDEIRVAHGVYYPDLGEGITPGNTDISFQLKNGVEIKGGYVGLDIPEKSNERSFNIFETTLSGYLNGEDEPNSPGTGLMSKCVVTGSYTNETAVLDGFTIIAPVRFSSLYYLKNTSGDPTIKNCKFALKAVNNTTFENCGLYNYDSNPQFIKCSFELDPNYTSSEYSLFIVMENKNSNPALTECIFSNNQYCMKNSRESNVILKDCTFLNNSDTVIKQDGGSLDIDGCSFFNNSIALSGRSIEASCIVNNEGKVSIKNTAFIGNNFSSSPNGRVFIDSQTGELTIDGCTFENNYSGNSAALISSNNSTIKNCTFINNICSSIYGSDLKVHHCRFSGNSISGGSVITVIESDVHNCIFEANTGFAISITPSVYRELYNCTFFGNLGDSVIKKMSYNYTLNLNNCIIRNNKYNTFIGNNINVNYSNFEGGFAGEGNIDIDPEFVRPGYWADVNNSDIVVNYNDPNAIWIMGDYHLKSEAGHWDSETETWVKDDISSPCIDSGNINSPIGFEPFPNGGISNLGAYGRSSEASKTYFNNDNCDIILAGDINGDSIVNSDDQYIIDSQWLLEGKDFINQTPKVTFIKPQDGDQVKWTGQFEFQAQAIDLDGEVQHVAFELGHKTSTTYYGIGTNGIKDGDIWSAYINTGSFDIEYGTWTVTARVTDNEGGVTKEVITITINAP